MPEVKMPDGVIVSFPDTMPPEQIRSLIASKFPDAPGVVADTGPGATAGMRFTNSVLGGFGDEITSAILTPVEMAKRAITGEDAGKGIGERITGAYRGLQQGTDKLLTDYAKKYPNRALAADIGGAAFTAGGLAGKGVTLAGKLGPSLPANVLTSLAEGGLYGTVYGQGNSSAPIGTAGNLTDTAIGAGTGAAFGAAAPVVARVAEPVVNLASSGVKAVGKMLPAPVRNALGVSTPADDAAALVVDRLGKSGRTVDEVANKLARAQQSGTPLAAVDIMGPSGKGLLRSATNVPGQARDTVSTKLALRDAASGDRVIKAAERAFNPAPKPSQETALAPFDGAVPPAAGGAKSPKITGGGYQAAKDAAIKARSTGSREAYDKAYSGAVPFSRDLEEILSTPAGRAGLSAAKRNSANRREPWKQFFASIDDDGNIIDMKRVPDVRALDEVKRVLDVMVEGAKRPADGSPFGRALATPESIAIQSVRDDLQSFMIRETGGEAGTYATALKSGATNIQADKALEFGRNALKMNPTKVALGINGMNETEKNLARQGAMEAMREEIHRSGDTHNVVLRLFGTKEKRNALRPFFRSSTEYNQFRTALLNEARMRKTFDAQRGNSTTAMQLADMQDASGANFAKAAGKAAMSTMVGGPKMGATSVLMDTARGLMNRVGGLSPEVANEAAKILMTREPDAVRVILDRLRDVEKAKLPDAQKRMLATALIRGAGLGVSEQ